MQKRYLKNRNNVLPISKYQKSIALIGPYAESRELMGVWKCEGKEEEVISIAEGIKDRLDFKIATGCYIHDITEEKM
ncbi:glycoside hydrolase family 3 C-terminal domain-containing protein [Clostridium thermarum]|uniref:glycoside hydrolase family 3 C-terminal domain-containing protein n=1 Tax=Clostridium thermarum TaxID=1716543 RepID=UPI0013D370E4|nr:glycoside hydrolase family 3 C-terminal domain-containing protein [Clostridium thermarum]